MTVEIITTLADIDPAQWNRLTHGNPFLRHEFLHALHETGCASERTGWAPRYLGTIVKIHGDYLDTRIRNTPQFFIDLGKRIAALRKEQRLTQQQLADSLGIAQQTLAHYEGGRIRAPASMLPTGADFCSRNR